MRRGGRSSTYATGLLVHWLQTNAASKQVLRATLITPPAWQARRQCQEERYPQDNYKLRVCTQRLHSDKDTGCNSKKCSGQLLQVY